MAYDGKIMRRALERYQADRDRRQEALQERTQAIHRVLPRVREIDEELQGTMSRVIATALRKGANPGPAIRALRDENLALQAEKAERIAAAGYPADYLEDKPLCAFCGDTGYQKGRVCRCLKEYYAREQIRELSELLDLGSQSFDTFSFDWYDERVRPELGVSPRANMEMVYEVCTSYAHGFSPDSGNLLLHGAPGLGKTFLSACIARTVSEKGFSVVYDTAGHIFTQFEDRKFNREREDADVDRVLRCDLLIMDDLGTELTTGFVQSTLYHIINTRLLTGKQTIINTNLTPDEIGRRYMRQIQSRLEGEYKILTFYGDDIRLLKQG